MSIRRWAARGALALSLSLMAAQPAQAQFWQCAPFARMISGISLFGNAGTWWAKAAGKFARGLNADDRIRIESVQNAIDQARCLAARLTGRRAAFDAVPWFWSDQGRNKLQIAGLSKPDDESFARGDAAASTVLRFRQGMLCAVETINRPGDHMAARKILTAAVRLTPEQGRSENFDLRALVRFAS